MPTLVIDTDDDGNLDVRVDGMLLLNGGVRGHREIKPFNPSSPAQVDVNILDAPEHETDDSVRHDTPGVVAIAAAAHEAVRQYQRAIGNTVFLPWSKSSGLVRGLGIEITRRIAAGEIHTPGELHDSWCALMAASGWKYGPVYDEPTRTSPYMTPFLRTPPMARKHARIFWSVAHAILADE